MANSELSPRQYWADDFGNRAFWFDAFVSHNRGDSSDSLVRSLRAEGARISSDHDGAPEGWPFPTFLFGQLSSSRCVVVSVPQKFRLSPWIRAEVNQARRVQASSGLDRVLVAVFGDRNHIPAELEGYPLFDVSTNEGFRELAGRLVGMNRLPPEMLDARFRLRRETNEMKLSKAAQALRAKLDAMGKPDIDDEAGLWWLAGSMLVDAGGHPGFQDRGDFPPRVVSALTTASPRIPTEFGDELISVARGMLGAGEYNEDERVWLLRLIAQAACGRPEYQDDFLDCLAAEANYAVAREMLGWVRRVGGPTGSDPRIAMAALVATDISGLDEGDIPHLSAGLPESVLARLQVHGEPNVDLAALTPGERMNIAAAQMPASLHSGSALQFWLREVAQLITTEHAPDGEWSWVPLNTERHTLVNCAMALMSIDWFIAYSKEQGGPPLVDLDADFSLWPILFSALHFPELSDYAHGVADRLETFFGEQADKADLPSDFVDYSGLLRAIFANWGSQEDIRAAVRAWRLVEMEKDEERSYFRALRGLSTDDPSPEA